MSWETNWRVLRDATARKAKEAIEAGKGAIADPVGTAKGALDATLEAGGKAVDATRKAVADPVGTAKGALDATLEAGQHVVDATGNAIDKVRSDKPK